MALWYFTRAGSDMDDYESFADDFSDADLEDSVPVRISPRATARSHQLRQHLSRLSPQILDRELSMSIPDGLFAVTPDLLPGQRIVLLVNREHSNRIRRGRGWSTSVVDVPTQLRFNLTAASCGEPNCHCGARVTAIAPVAKRRGQASRDQDCTAHQ